MVGRQLDRYRLVEEIGSGGMAVVYKGIDTALDREVAVKVMHPHLAGKEESRKRFRREARAVAKLHHPSILEIYDFSGDEAKESFIVTEYVRGRTLRAFGDEVGFRLAETAALAIAVLAEALQHAHETGIVHRDLKPENVMVREDGVLKLMDFGIARLVEGDEKMTMTGSLVGSPLHMPPEVIEGRPGDVRSDLFSLGTIFYWLVTKQMAFQAATTTLTLRRILEGQFEDPRTLAPACPDELADAISRCLARDPEARFPDVQALRDALKPTLLFAGFERPGEELKRFFADPAAFEAALRARLVPALVTRGEAALAAKKTSRALQDFDRVLALDPENARVKEQLARLRSARASRQRRKRLAIGAMIAVGAGGLGVGIVSLLPPPPPPAVPVTDPPPIAPLEPPPTTPLEPPLATPGEPIAAVTERPPVAKLPKPPPPKAGAPRVEPTVGPKVDPATPSMATITDWRTVRIRFAPQTAVLWLDGEPQKTSDAPWFEKQLRAGSRVALALVDPSCCERHDEIVEIPRGLDRDDVLDLRYLLKPKNAKVLIASNRADAQVWVENSFKGTVRDVAGKGGFPVAFDPRDRYARRFEVALVDPRTDERRAAEVNVTAGGTATLRVDF